MVQWNQLVEQAQALSASTFGAAQRNSQKSNVQSSPGTNSEVFPFNDELGDRNAPGSASGSGGALATWPVMPVLQKSISQIGDQARHLVARRGINVGDENGASAADMGRNVPDFIRGQALLASKGFDTQVLGDSLQAEARDLHAGGPSSIIDADANQSRQPDEFQLSEVDVQGYLGAMQESILIGTIETTRVNTSNFAAELFERTILADWERTKTAMSHDDVELRSSTGPSQRQSHSSRTLSFGSGDLAHSSSKAFANPTSRMVSSEFRAHDGADADPMQMHSRKLAYYQCTKKLNEARLHQYPFGYFHFCRNVALQMENLPVTAPVSTSIAADSWSLLQKLVAERDTEAAWRHGHVEASPNSSEARLVRWRLVRGSRKWLEDSFASHVEAFIAFNSRQAQLGGRPDVISKFQAYTTIKLSADGQWTIPNLECVKGVPIYAHIWHLLRGGHHDEAVQVAETTYRDYLSKTSPSFTAILKDAVNSLRAALPQSLSEPNRTQALNEWVHELKKGHSTEAHGGRDGFRVALYKWFGLCDVTGPGSKKNVSNVTNTSNEDYMWYQLLLVSENQSEENATGYSLLDLQQIISGYGAQHFCSRRKNPWIYLRVLLLCGQFENAVDYLVRQPNCYVEAVHIAIGLAYYGLLTPTNAKLPRGDLVKKENNKTAIHFTRLLQLYMQTFAKTNPEEALEYVALLRLKGVSGDTAMEDGKESESIKEAILDVLSLNANWDVLLGGLGDNGNKFPGLLQKFAPLLRIRDENRYINSIIHDAASKIADEGAVLDAMKLYNLSESYDDVLSLLNKALTTALSRYTDHAMNVGGRSGRTRNDFAADIMGASPKDTIAIAENILAYYNGRAELKAKVRHEKMATCKVLIQLLHFFELTSQQRWSEAVNKISALDLLPLSSKTATIDIPQMAAQLQKQYDEHLLTHIDGILITTMQCLAYLYEETKASTTRYNDESRTEELDSIKRRAKILHTFAAALENRVQGDTFTALVDIFARIS